MNDIHLMRESLDHTPRFVGCCELFDQIAKGGFATVYLGRWLGVAGFSKIVAIKRLHGQFADQQRVLTMFANEARIVARINHPNVLPTIDLVQHDDELFIVMEYVDGIPLSKLLKCAKQNGERVPAGVALRIMLGVLAGLHAAHEATDARGAPMHIVHRDVSPDNVLIRASGRPLILDFGVAKAIGMTSTTVQGEIKGRLSYMAPEQVLGNPSARTSDIFAASILLWEMLTWKRLFKGRNAGEVVHALMTKEVRPPTSLRPELSTHLSDVVLRGLERDPKARWSTAAELASALERSGQVASPENVAQWTRKVAGSYLDERAEVVRRVELTPIDEELVQQLRQTPGLTAARTSARPSAPASSDPTASDPQAAEPHVPPPSSADVADPAPARPSPIVQKPLESATPTRLPWSAERATAASWLTPKSSPEPRACAAMEFSQNDPIPAPPPLPASRPAVRQKMNAPAQSSGRRTTRADENAKPSEPIGVRTSSAAMVFSPTADVPVDRTIFAGSHARVVASAAALLLGGTLALTTMMPTTAKFSGASAATTGGLLQAERELSEALTQLVSAAPSSQLVHPKAEPVKLMDDGAVNDTSEKSNSTQQPVPEPEPQPAIDAIQTPPPVRAPKKSTTRARATTTDPYQDLYTRD